MSTRIPLELSSTLDATQRATLLLGASAEVSPYGNETDTAGKAPVLVSIAANRTVDADEFAKLMLENGNQGTLPQARLVVNAVAAVLTRLAEDCLPDLGGRVAHDGAFAQLYGDGRLWLGEQ